MFGEEEKKREKCEENTHIKLSGNISDLALGIIVEKKHKKCLYCRCQDKVLAEWGKLAKAAALDEVNCVASEWTRAVASSGTRNKILFAHLKSKHSTQVLEKSWCDNLINTLRSISGKYVHVLGEGRRKLGVLIFITINIYYSNNISYDSKN